MLSTAQCKLWLWPSQGKSRVLNSCTRLVTPCSSPLRNVRRQPLAGHSAHFMFDEMQGLKLWLAVPPLSGSLQAGRQGFLRVDVLAAMPLPKGWLLQPDKVVLPSISPCAAATLSSKLHNTLAPQDAAPDGGQAWNLSCCLLSVLWHMQAGRQSLLRVGMGRPATNLIYSLKEAFNLHMHAGR